MSNQKYTNNTQTEKKKSKVKKKGVIRRTGASLYGKFASVVITEKAVEVYTSPAIVLILGLWIFAMAFFGISMFFGNLILSMILTAIGGALGFYVAMQYFPGKQRARFEYGEIASFIMEPPAFFINGKDNNMFELRMMPKKQALLIGDIKTALDKNYDYKLERAGRYYKVLPRQAMANPYEKA